MKIRPISFRDVTRLLSRHFWQRFAHRFRSSRSFFDSFKKKEIATNSLRWPRAIHQKNNQKFGKWKVRVPHRRRCWRICRSWSQQKHSEKDAQRRSIDEVVFAKWKRNKTTPRHTAVRIRRLPQQISIVCEKKVGDEYEPTTLWGIIASVEYLKNLRCSESIVGQGQRSTVELFERHLFKRISQFRDETVDQFVCRLCV